MQIWKRNLRRLPRLTLIAPLSQALGRLRRRRSWLCSNAPAARRSLAVVPRPRPPAIRTEILASVRVVPLRPILVEVQLRKVVDEGLCALRPAAPPDRHAVHHAVGPLGGFYLVTTRGG